MQALVRACVHGAGALARICLSPSETLQQRQLAQQCVRAASDQLRGRRYAPGLVEADFREVAARLQLALPASGGRLTCCQVRARCLRLTAWDCTVPCAALCVSTGPVWAVRSRVLPAGAWPGSLTLFSWLQASRQLHSPAQQQRPLEPLRCLLRHSLSRAQRSLQVQQGSGRPAVDVQLCTRSLGQLLARSACSAGQHQLQL